MRIEFKEHAGCFAFELSPESQEDAVQLARLAVNGVKEVRGIYVNAHTDLTMTAAVVIGKRKKPESRLA